VGRFLVCRWSRVIPVDFHQYEPADIVRLLHNVESGDAWFFDRRPGILQGGGYEVVNAPRLHMNLNVDGEHDVEFVLAA
jgi:hypothetical protein